MTLVLAFKSKMHVLILGFGDFIPGTKITKGQNAKLLTVCLYSFLGMAIMGMCYNVIFN